MRVILSFDAHYGAAEAADLGDAFWLLDSAANRSIAKTAWSSGHTDPNSAVFKAEALGSAPDFLAAKLEDIDLHHPGWTEIVISGLPRSLELEAEMSASGRHAFWNGTGWSVRR